MIPLLQVVFYPVTSGSVAGMFIILILLACSALISGSEVAYFSLTPSEVNELKEKNSRRNRTAVVNLENPERLLATILISNNFVNIGIVILSSFLVNSLVDFSGSPVLGFLVKVVIITFLLLIFGEIIPKVYANYFSVRFALFMAIPIRWLDRLFSPLVYVLVTATSAVNRRMANKRKNISMTDLSDALDLTTGVVTDEKKILEGIVKFGNLEVSEIMRPRMDVVAVEYDLRHEELVKIIIESGYSRIPVYKENFDHIEGVLYVKDLLPLLYRNKRIKWQNLIRPPFFVPENKKINDLLLEFQQKKIHLAVVVDEYGGTEGIVTLEDILEEVVGEITDDSDENEEFFTRIDDRTFLFDGKTLLNDFFKVTHLDDSLFEDVEGTAETIAGLILELKGEFPKLKDIVVCKNIEFTVTSMDKRRIREVRVHLKDEE
ncbi:MAG: gliding motility-associated protein GldE [Bacteroidota bacterium]